MFKMNSPSTAAATSNVEITLVPFRHGTAPADHPDLQPLLNQGWTIKRTVLRLVEGGLLKHLVVLHRAALAAPTMSQTPPLPAGPTSTT
jgi:hypothetical protein